MTIAGRSRRAVEVIGIGRIQIIMRGGVEMVDFLSRRN